MKLHALKWATYIVGGLAAVFLLFSLFFNFVGANDAALIQQLGIDFVRALKEDRRAVFRADTFRSLVLVLLTAALLYFLLQEKVKKNLAFVGLGILIVFDLVLVDKRYVNSEDFVKSSVVERPFQPNAADKEIMKDKGHYRVFDLSGNPFNTARTSFFHNAVGGYHAAKPGRMQELYDFYISQNNLQVLNMLNTKYFIVPTEEGIMAQENPEANSHAWFVQEVKFVEDANEELLALKGINTKKVAVVEEGFKDLVEKNNFSTAGSSQIDLISYQPNELKYQYSSSEDRLAVFSEIYYPHGWQAYIDGKAVPHFRANYVLRAMMLPQGAHELVFKFEPQVVETGSSIALISSILLGLLFVGGVVYRLRKN
jgi:outer membrane lipoprotein-sorting protein